MIHYVAKLCESASALSALKNLVQSSSLSISYIQFNEILIVLALILLLIDHLLVSKVKELFAGALVKKPLFQGVKVRRFNWR